MQNPVSHFRNSDDILIGLGRQAEHIVKLNAVPPSLKGDPTGVKKIFFCHILVDGITQPLTATLHSECQSTLTYTLQPVHQFHGKIIRTERRK